MENKDIAAAIYSLIETCKHSLLITLAEFEALPPFNADKKLLDVI